ncbi:Inner membrane protein YbiR [Slackia heliotrinireducens]|uniref:Na+/H+ antiporter NhaD-like permease n=1 Tax=Slackia heliotrinireducens (strain ATCC 29202 / DSM 20476 / NCTC 11029 / RHS 1) TaxID=471855 RepID=C7N3B6_SLAHD|nr:ArsB/NhaD family transporter [Slackia heliotrinireducens]ACV23639.1 Na+/H+ antiporter NhaD-like permease [Slackia heliotrinireducens DSM 20476]VEH03146.1 Inner membrane protein YbiR [Slackia heliotrinireducens]
MGFAQIFAIVVFLVAMTLIVSEKVHRTVVALAGAMLLIIFHVMDFETAIGHIDYNTLGVLFGMMLFVAVVRQSGLFEFLAIKCAKLAKGDPWHIMILFAILTAVLSAFLDNVTTVLLIGPMTLTICELLKINPMPFFMVEIMSSNVGGTATLIGDPPNIMIGSAAGYSFADFIAVDAPVVVVIMVVIIGVFYVLYGRKMHVTDEEKARVMELEPAFEDEHLMKLSVVILAIVVVGFMIHGKLGIESSVVAISAAALILLLSRRDVTKALLHVEWTTLAFFAGLFIIVGGMVETGTIDALANALIDVTGGDVFLTMIVLVFASAIISSFLDNIPFVATMIPILLAMEGSGMDVTPLWWAVSLGACLGGNGTLIGASANVVLSDIAAKHGHPITFIEYLKTGFPVMILTVVISCVYLILRFPPM